MKWKNGQDLGLQDIVTLKLYTDFDLLQYSLVLSLYIFFRDPMWSEFDCFRLSIDLKQCFRSDILETDDPKRKQEKIKELQERLQHFWYWRINLLLVLNKFGKRLRENNNMVLYHGSNQRMLISVCSSDPSSLPFVIREYANPFGLTQPRNTFAFFGPFSTSSSYHVARTFATAKGMVLSMTSHFPRLGLCNAFDAKLLSDYPEEQEWLIGFCYVRILKIDTRHITGFTGKYNDLQTLPFSSLAKEVCFRKTISLLLTSSQ